MLQVDQVTIIGTGLLGTLAVPWLVQRLLRRWVVSLGALFLVAAAPLFASSGLPGSQALKTNFAADLAAKQIDKTLHRVGQHVDAIWFGRAEVRDQLPPSQRCDVAFRLNRRSFGGETRLQMLIDDVRHAANV